jgi:tetratricopeptide (TPR) repeat protein
MTTRLRVLAGAVVLIEAAVVPAATQGPPAAPNVSRAHRAALHAIVRAMDTGTSIADVVDDQWAVHLLRASDGSHYVAFSITGMTGLPAKRPVVLYVRLATRRDPRVAAVAERSAVAEWLVGQTPSPAIHRPGIAFGDMPTYGAGAIAARGPGPQSLQLLELERERARERREAEERQRKASLEGETTLQGPRPLLPFEDFDVRAIATAEGSGRASIRRSLTAGPGDFDLLVGWTDPEARDPGSAVRIFRRRLTLAPASSTEFALSSVIVADNVAVREVPVPAAEQSARPYSIGPMDITPAPDRLFTTDERLAVVVQVINPRGSPTGKPDVAVGFRIFRNNAGKEEAVGTLAPQTYNDTTLPADFDVARGQPLFAAVAVPLRAFKRGEYRLEIAANDRVAGTGTTASSTFTIVATPAALLREAPPAAAPFRRDELLEAEVVGELVAKLAPPRPSAAMSAAIESARAGRFVDLIREDATAPEEVGARQVLRALALYAIGESSGALAVPLRQASQGSASQAAVQLLMGAAFAVERNDRSAVTAWETAIEAGADARVVTPLLADALLRLGDPARALDVAQRATGARSLRRVAAAHLAAGRYSDALRVADEVLAARADDADAQWLALHALFAGLASGSGPGADPAGRARIADLAAAYATAKGPHAALARDWAAAAK